MGSVPEFHGLRHHKLERSQVLIVRREPSPTPKLTAQKLDVFLHTAVTDAGEIG